MIILRKGNTGTSMDELETFAALQKIFTQPVTGKLDDKLFFKILEDDTPFPAMEKPEPPAKYIESGDWMLMYPNTSYFKMCIIRQIPGKMKWKGRILTSVEPSPVARNVIGEDTFSFFATTDKLFDPKTPVVFAAGKSNVRIFASSDGYFVPEPPMKIAAAGLLLTGERSISITGTSKFGGPLKIEWSANGFIGAFKEMNSRCADNKLNWFVNMEKEFKGKIVRQRPN